MSEDRPLVLLLGTSRYLPQACVRHGVDAVVVSGPEERDDGFVEVPAGVTVLPVDDQRSPEAVLMALHRSGWAARRFDAVVTSDEFALVTAAVLARSLGCRAIDADTAVRFRDKWVQKKTVAAAGVPTARVTLVEDVFDVSGISQLPYSRAVLKPVAGAGTELTHVVDDLADLRALSARHRDSGIGQRTFVLEEFVGGEEWIADGVVFDGQVRFVALGTYGEPCLTVVGEGLPLSMRRFDPDDEEWAYRRAGPAVRRALEALGLRDGVFHMELFHDPGSGRVVFSECGARRGGALVQEETQAKFNVDLGEAMLLCGLGRLPALDVKTDPATIGSTYLLGRPGILAGVPSREELAALPGVRYARVSAPVGTRIAAGVASSDQRLAEVLVGADSAHDLARRLEEIRTWFADRIVVVPEAKDARTLRAWQRQTCPEDDFGDTLWR
ncbi:hypothetical protein ACIHCV_28980 [Streptomyces sp. NPDC051956]|uniref:hypothetical protein n=1 Tax=Streptomyces sp. NPDC051956 TaxID=3365677 RepID=UPI0037D6A5F3